MKEKILELHDMFDGSGIKSASVRMVGPLPKPEGTEFFLSFSYENKENGRDFLTLRIKANKNGELDIWDGNIFGPTPHWEKFRGDLDLP